MTNYQETRTTQHEAGQEQRAFTFKATQVIWLFLGILESLIALRILFKLIAVNAENPFANLLYSTTHLFVAPFTSLVGAPAAGGMVFEFYSIIAMIVYWLVGWGVERIIYVFFYRSRGTVSVTQTHVAEHTPQQATLDSSQTTVTTKQPDPRLP